MAAWLNGYEPVRKLPRLWIETIWLVESREPLKLTRTVDLHPGLNIVWAKESDDENATGLVSAGHGVGKTSLCLLTRFLLGDEAPAISSLREKAVGAFPKGGVSARVHLDGEAWLVFRPYGAHGHSFAARSDTLDELFQSGGPSDFQDYLSALERFSVGRLPAQSLPGTNQPIRWRHLLAWCMRDQRTRFDAFFHWRDGEGLGFGRPRRDPPLFFGAVVGLLDATLDKLLREAESKQLLLERGKERIPELERAPAYALAHAEHRLRSKVSAPEDEPMFRTTDGLSLESRVQATLAAALEQEERWEQQVEQAENRVAQEQLHLARLQNQMKRAEIEAGIARALLQANQADFERLTGLRQKLDSLEGRCDHGDVEFSDCQHIAERKSSVSITWFKEGRQVAGNVEAMSQQLRRWESELVTASGAVTKQSSLLATLQVELRRMRVRIATSESSRAAFREGWDELQLLHAGRVDGADTPELVREKERLTTLESDVDSLKAALATRKGQQSARADAIKALTACVASRILGTSGHARFVPDSEVRPFEVAKGGEAYQVLEVLLGDVVCLLDSATSQASSHPGFLVHDCPREADMSSLLYREFFLTAAEAAAQLGDDGDVPFQFIVTTTSSPPATLQGRPYVVLELAPGSDESLLFKRELVPELPGFN
jgi:hypothetical protein